MTTDQMRRQLRMILNTFYSGSQAWFFLAQDRGYLREEGIELEFVEGDTAANAVPKVASGAYDVGYGDLNTLMLPHPQMVSQMLDERRWDGLFGFVNTLRAASIEADIDPDRHLRFLEYRHFVPELYGSALMVTRSLATAEPEIVAGLVRAVNRGLVDTVADIDAAIEAVVRRNPGIDGAANRERLAGTLALEMANSEGARLGIGDVDPVRLSKAIDLIVDGRSLARRPAPDEVFMARFLLPLGDRVRTLARSQSV